MLIQTAFPGHVLFNALRGHDFPAFAGSLLQEREIMQFPPYSYLAVLRPKPTTTRWCNVFSNMRRIAPMNWRKK